MVTAAMKELDCMLGICLIFEETVKLFSKVTTHLIFPQQCVKVQPLHSITGSEFLSDSLSSAAIVKQQALHHLRRSLATADPGNSLRDLEAGRRYRGLGK